MKKREQRKPTFAEALLPLIAMLIILTVGYGGISQGGHACNVSGFYCNGGIPSGCDLG